jgi:hypothetical protein
MALIGKSSMNSRVILFFWRADLFTHWVNKSNCGAVAKKQNITFIFNDLHTGSSAKFQPQLRGLGLTMRPRSRHTHVVRAELGEAVASAQQAGGRFGAQLWADQSSLSPQLKLWST